MKRTALSLTLLSSLLLASPLLSLAPVQAAETTFVRSAEGINEYKLANGLKVLLVENHAAPVVSVVIV
jgi:hypothetical protein